MGLLGSAFQLSFNKLQGLLDQVLGVEINRGAISTLCKSLCAALE